MRKLRHSEASNNQSYMVEYTELESEQAAPECKLHPVLPSSPVYEAELLCYPALTDKKTETKSLLHHRAGQYQCQHLT